MGAYASQFRNVGNVPLSEITHPSKADWITAHATASGLAIVEIERLWERFEQLGCTKEGILTEDVLTRSPASDDIFAKNILTVMRSDDGQISFQTFINIMKWGEMATLESKMRGFFHLLNGGNPISRDLLAKILAKLYPEDSPAAILDLTKLFLSQIDKNRYGSVYEEDFMNWMKTMPAEDFRPYLDFAIVPPEINEQAQQAFTAATAPQTAQPQPSNTSIKPKELVTEALLRTVAQQAKRRDWLILGNKLNFVNEQIEDIERNYPADAETQVFELLKLWREREGPKAYTEKLERALRESNMNDIAVMLLP